MSETDRTPTFGEVEDTASDLAMKAALLEYVSKLHALRSGEPWSDHDLEQLAWCCVEQMCRDIRDGIGVLQRGALYGLRKDQPAS